MQVWLVQEIKWRNSDLGPRGFSEFGTFDRNSTICEKPDVLKTLRGVVVVVGAAGIKEVVVDKLTAGALQRQGKIIFGEISIAKAGGYRK